MRTEFDGCADAYEEFRPGYPADLFDFLAERFRLAAGATVVDVGAGTGRATRPLAERGYRVIAVEPSEAMRAQGAELEKLFGDRVRFGEGTAEETGLPAGCGDLLVCAQAFHWFDAARALTEFSRVLKPGAGLAIFWNDRDSGSATIGAELEALISRFNPSYRCEYRDRAWEVVIRASGHFTDVVRRVFPHAVSMTAESLLGLTRSFSYVRNVLTGPATTAFERELRELVARRHGDRPFELAYELELYAAERRRS